MPWEMDCNIDLIAKNERSERIFTIKVNSYFWEVTIKYLNNNQTFITIH